MMRQILVVRVSDNSRIIVDVEDVFIHEKMKVIPGYLVRQIIVKDSEAVNHVRNVLLSYSIQFFEDVTPIDIVFIPQFKMVMSDETFRKFLEDLRS